ncbi:MAG: cupredoxin domain-containing protein [Actinomycetota bacterium]
MAARRSVPYLILPVVGAIAGLFLLLPRTGTGVTVHIRSHGGRVVYEPSTPSVARGARITFVNDTRGTHTASCVKCPWDSGDVQPGQSVPIEIAAVGTYEFFCRYHGLQGGESGTLTVTS